MTKTAAVRAELVRDIESTKQTIAMGEVYSKQWSKLLPKKEALLAKFDAINPDVDAIMAMDKASIRNVPEETFEVVREALWGIWLPSSAAFGAEVSRRKAAATKAANAADKALREASGVVFADGSACEVHAFGHWYAGTVVRTTRTGSVVVRYTSGTGVTREKTVGADLIRK